MKLPFHTAGNSVGLPVWAFGSRDPVRVMLIDDDRDEALLTRSLLARVTDVKYEMDWVPTFGEGIASIGRGEHNAFLIDHHLGGRTGVELVREARESGSLSALIMLTGQRDRTTDMAAMDAGATDFLMKGRTDAAMLDRTLRYSITQAAMVSALDRSRNQLAGLEELGQILVEDGPTPAAVARVVDLIVDRFSLARVAIYLADGDTLHLAGQRGYEHPLASVSRTDSSVERVSRARQPIFVPSLSPEFGADGLGSVVATELSVPLLVGGELGGLLNVASLVTSPIGEADYAGIRLVADRLAAALEVARERRVADDRLSKARFQLRTMEQPSVQEGLIDGETVAYRRPMLEPLLEIAIASAGTDPGGKLGMLVVACEDAAPGAITQLAERTRAVCAGRPIVRFGATSLAVVVVATDEGAARSEARDLVALAGTDGLVAWGGYAALARDGGAVELIAAAEANLVVAQRMGPGTVG